MTKHNYAAYYTKIKPQPLSEETQIEKLTQLTQYLPTRQMTIKSAQVDVTFENEFENLTLSLQEAEFVQNEIMYKVSRNIVRIVDSPKSDDYSKCVNSPLYRSMLLIQPMKIVENPSELDKSFESVV